MSVTTTDNARITTVRHILADYELHHSEPTEDEAAAAPPPNEHDEPISESNPPGWDTEHRRVPPFRPVQNQRDEQRDTYNNEIERNFVRVMFGGVYTMAVCVCASLLMVGANETAADEPNMAKYWWKAEQ